MPSDYLKDLIAKAKKSKMDEKGGAENAPAAKEAPAPSVPMPELVQEQPQAQPQAPKPAQDPFSRPFQSESIQSQSVPVQRKPFPSMSTPTESPVDLEQQEQPFARTKSPFDKFSAMASNNFKQQQESTEEQALIQPDSSSLRYPSEQTQAPVQDKFSTFSASSQEEEMFPNLKKEQQKAEVMNTISNEIGPQKSQKAEYEPTLNENQQQSVIPSAEEMDEFEEEEKIELDSYGDVKVYRIPSQPLLHYTVPVPRPNSSEKAIISTIKEAATRLIQISPFKIRDAEQRRTVYRQRILDILKSSPEIKIPKGKFQFYTDAVVREMVGYGLIDPLVKDDKLEEIMVIGEKKTVYVFHREYEMMTTNIKFISNSEINDLINRIAREVGRRVDMSNPLLDARMPDGSRVNATINPASISGSTLTIRKFKKDPFSIVDLVNVNTLSIESAAFLWLAYEGMQVRPANILIAGGTGSGKTTLLNVLASYIPDSERVITIEDTAELNLPLKHWIRMESRPPGLEGKGEITLDILTKNALRMRPDRILVGEIRHDEAFSLFTAMNTGHDGCLTPEIKMPFTDGIQSIGEFVDSAISTSNKIERNNKWEIVDVKDKHVNSLNDRGKIVKTPVVKAMRREYAGKVMHIKLASGSEITVTPNHPFFELKDNLSQVRAENLQESQFIATPRTLIRDKKAQEKETEYWSGLLHGDGNLYERERIREKNGKQYLCKDASLSLYTEESKIIPKFESFLKKNFNNTHVGISQHHGENCFKVAMSGVEKTKQAKQLFQIPSGSRLKGAVDNSHYQNSVEEFVAGFFDAEGYVDLENNALVFTCANEEYIDFVKYALLTRGIISRKYESTSHNSRWFRLYIYGIGEVRKFAKSFSIRYPEKKSKLEKMLSEKKVSNTNVDVLPCTYIIKEMILEAKKNGISERKIAKESGISQRMLRFLHLGKRMPSRITLEKLSKGINKCGIKATKLKELASSDIFWDKIVAIHEFDYNGFVYDLTVSDTKRKDVPHNFVAEGMLIGNSSGTVHANSAQETLIRVTTPPMDVPEMMLSGLDIILVESRIHDRKKGTIRRVTEISEVTGVLEGKAQVQAIYERDAAKDTLVKTGVPSNFLKKIRKLSGLSMQEIEIELKARERLIKRLMKEDIHNIDETSTAMKAFLLEGNKK